MERDVDLCAGLFIALMLHFDARNMSGKRYFYSAMVGYSAGLTVTIAVMNIFKAAQPALLYIVPGVCIAVFAQAAWRGEVKQLWGFADEDGMERDEGSADTEKAAEVAADEGTDLRTFDAGQTAPGFEVVGELKKHK
jgi:minor histocompatibility antigen H13